MKSRSPQKFVKWVASLSCLSLTITQVSCQPNRNYSRLIVASAGKIKSVDPAQASTFGALQLISALGDPLYRLDTDGNLKPFLASSIPIVSDKGKTITIPLRENILFHDGTKFDAEAMAFSLNRFMRIGTMSYIFGNLITSIEATEPYLLQLRLKRPSSSINGLLTSINLTPISPSSYIKYKNTQIS